MAVEIAVVWRSRKLPWQLPRTSVAIAAYRRIAVKIAADGRGNCCGLTSVEIAVEITEDFHSNCRV